MNVELARAAGARLLFGVVESREELDDAVSITRMPCVLRGDGHIRCRVAGRPRSAGSATPMPRVSWPSSVIVPGFRSRQ